MELVFGRQEKLEALTLNHGDDVEELTRQVKEKAKELDDGDGGLVLVDLLGGSPCNVTASPPVCIYNPYIFYRERFVEFRI